MTYPDHDPFQAYSEFGSGRWPAPAATAAPATPTEAMVVDGIQLEPAARLLALAKVRDHHRAAGRAANDAMHSAREAIEDRQMRIRRIQQSEAGRGSISGQAEIGQLRAELDQFASARSTAQAEAEAAATAFGDADQVLKAALRFAREHGAVIPATLAQEAR